MLSFMADDQRYLAILLSGDWEAQNSDGKEDRVDVVLIDLFSGDPIGTVVLLGLLQTRWTCQWTELEPLAIHFTCRIINSFNSSIPTSRWPSLEQDKMSSKFLFNMVIHENWKRNKVSSDYSEMWCVFSDVEKQLLEVEQKWYCMWFVSDEQVNYLPRPISIGKYCESCIIMQ